MVMASRALLAPLLWLLLPMAAAASALDCPPARDLWQLGPDRAESHARTCVAEGPSDPQRLHTLSLVIGWKEQHDQALGVAEVAAAHAPEDLDLLAWRLRLLGWLGRFEEADALAATAGDGGGEHPDLQQVLADLARWRGDGRGAPGRSALGIRLQAGPVVTGNEDTGWLGRFGVDGWLLPTLHLAGTFEMHERGFEDARRRDALFAAAALVRFLEDFTLEAGAGYSPNPSFTPVWNGHLELGWHLGRGFTAFARYWHIAFRGASVEVLSPALLFEGGGFWASLRAWQGFEAQRSGTSVLAQGGLSLFGPIGLSAGIGGGNRADYLVIRETDTEGHLVGLAGISWSPSQEVSLRLDYVGRRESVGSEELFRHEFLMGVHRRW